MMTRIAMTDHEDEWRQLVATLDLMNGLAGEQVAAVLGLEYTSNDPWDLCPRPTSNALLVLAHDFTPMIDVPAIGAMELQFAYDASLLPGRVTEEARAAAVLHTLLGAYALEHADAVTLEFPNGSELSVPALGPGARLAYELGHVAADIHDHEFPDALDDLLFIARVHPAALRALGDFTEQHRPALSTPPFQRVVDRVATALDNRHAGAHYLGAADQGDSRSIGTEIGLVEARALLHRIGATLLERAPQRLPEVDRRLLGPEPPSLN